MSKRYFTDVEDAFIVDNFTSLSESALGKHLNRTKASIGSRINVLQKRGLIPGYSPPVPGEFNQPRSNYNPNTDRIPNLTQRTWLSI